MFLIYIWVTFLIGLVILFRISLIYDAVYKKSDHTECPNCSSVAPTEEKGRHTCKQCQFDFDVNRKGEAEKYSKSEIYKEVVGGLLSLVLLTYLAPDFLAEYNNTQELNIKHVIVLVGFSYLAVTSISGIITGLKGNKFYQSQRK